MYHLCTTFRQFITFYSLHTVINTEFREHLVVVILKKLLDIFVNVFICEFNNSVILETLTATVNVGRPEGLSYQ